MNRNSAFIRVGRESLLAKEEIVVITRPQSDPVRRLISFYKRAHKFIDLTHGRRARAVVFTASGYAVLVPSSPKTLVKRFLGTGGEEGK